MQEKILVLDFGGQYNLLIARRVREQHVLAEVRPYNKITPDEIRYMLDTNMIAYVRNRHPICVLQKLQQHDPSEICISSITLAELEFGIFNSSKPA